MIGAATGLPDWFKEYRAPQERAIDQTVKAFEDGARVVVMEAPTGAGKTLIAEGVRQQLDVRGLYVATTKTLQAQFATDYPYAKVLQGRDNYPTHTTGVSAESCVKQDQSCHWCDPVHDCPYEIAKQGAMSAGVAVLNTAYYLTEANGPGRFSQRGFVVLDEADTLEDQLQKYIGLRITQKQALQYGITPVEKVTVEKSWLEWVDRSLANVETIIGNEGPVGQDAKPGTIKRRQTMERLKDKLRFLTVALREDEWVYTGRDGVIEFKPVTLKRSGFRFLWRHASRFLVMSATIISAQQMMEDLGYVQEGENRWVGLVVPSSFPASNRPVRVVPVADTTKKAIAQATFPLMQAITRIVGKHQGENVLVHTVNYKLAADLARTLNHQPLVEGQVLTYRQAGDRAAALEAFRDGAGAILLAPSLDRGIDLPDDACRVQVVAKIPFPNLGDRQIRKRRYSEGGHVWYAVATIRTLVQMTGRAVRHSEDYAVTYILDAGFPKFYRQWKHLFPAWWSEALDWRYTL